MPPVDTQNGPTNVVQAASLLADSVETQEQDVANEASEVEAQETVEEVEETEAGEVEAAEEETTDAESDDEDDSEAEEQEPQTPPTYTIKVAGEEVEVTLDELQKGYARQADYTRKTQELAAQRKETEKYLQQLQQQQEQYTQAIEALNQKIQESQEAEPDWDSLYQRDPVEWVRQRELWRSKKEQQNALEAERQRLTQEKAVEQQKQLSAKVQEEQERLLEALPEWKDEEVAKKEKVALVEYGVRAGFTQQELAQAYDHRAVLLLHKARLYDEMVAKRENLEPKKQTTKTAKPGAAKTPADGERRNSKKLMQRLSQTGRPQDAARVLEQML